MEDRDLLRHHVKGVRAELEGSLAATSSSLRSHERKMYMEPSASLLSNNCRQYGKTSVGVIHSSHGLDGYEGVRDEEDDEGLYLALSSMPVKVEIEEEGDGEIKTNDYNPSHGNSLTDLSRTEIDHGIADASASWYNPQVMNSSCLMGSTILSPSQVNYTFISNNCNNDRELQKKLLAQERAKKYRESLTAEQLEALRERNRERAKKRRMMMTEEELFMERVKNRESAQMRRMCTKETGGSRGAGNVESECLDDTEEKKMLTTREKNRERMRLKRLNMTEEEKNVERQKNRERVRKRRQLLKAESLLKKLIDARNDMIKINPHEDPKNITVQNLVTVNGYEETGPHISGEFK